MYNHTPDNARGGLGPRHGEDPSFSGGSHGLGIANSQHHQHQHQQYSQPQVHDPHQQSHFPSDFGFVSSTPHDPPSMNDYSASMGHGQAQYQTQGDAMDVEDTNESKPRVTNLIKQFETRSRRPSRSGHNVPGSASTAFARATNSLGVASPNAEQFTSSLRVRSGSIGRPPPIRFGSMGQQGHSGLRVASPMASQAREAHGNREHNPHAPDAGASSFGTMSGSTDMSTSLRSQSSNVGGGMRPGHVGNISANLYSNVDTLSSSAGHFEGPSSPYGFANSANRAVRPMHMMGNFGGMGEAAGSPIIGTPTSPFGRMDFAAPQVTSPVQSPPTDPFGELANFGTSMGHNPAASPFDTMSPGGRVTTPMQPSAGAGTYRDAGMHGTEDTFVGSHADHFQGLDPFNSMGSINQHVTHQFGDMSAAASMETWGDLGVFAKEEPSSEPTQFDAISPAPRNNDMAQTPMQTSMNFTGQGYFGSQPPQPPPQMPQQQPRQQPQLPPRSRPRPVPSQPPARPAKKPFLRQQDTAGEGSTPGFNIWKPPVPSTPKPAIGHIQQRSSAMSPTSNVPFLPLSQSDVKAEPGITLSSQQYDADMRVTSPNTAMPSSVASPMRDTPSVSSPNPPPLPVRPQQGARPSREQVPAEAWEAVKGTIRQLYLEERKPLKDVIQVMADRHGFQATPKMYKTRFSQWGFVKNNTEDEVKKLLSMKFQRDARGKVTEFVRNGRVINLSTYLKRKGVTEYELVNFEGGSLDLPTYVKCRTPTPPPVPGYLRSPELLRTQDGVVGNLRKAFLQCRQLEIDTRTVVGWSTVMVWGAGSSELLYEASRRMGANGAAHEIDLDGAFRQLGVDLANLSPQGIIEVLLAMVRRDLGMTTALSKYLAAYATTNFDRADPLRQILTILYEVQQKHGPVMLSDLVWGSIPAAADELESIYSRQHPYVARAWIDLALTYNHVDGERLEGLVAEYQALSRSVEAREGANSSDAFALRYALVQLMHAVSPDSDATRAEASALWDALKECGRANPMRSAEGNAYCVHDAVKVTPWVTRCRERYETVTGLLRRHVGVVVEWYFEEDMHTAEHALAQAPDARDAWAAALGHSSMGMGHHGRF